MNQELFPPVIPAALEDYPAVQNMVRLYAYGLSPDYGFMAVEQVLPADRLYESFDFQGYFQDPMRKAYPIKVKDERKGLVLLKQVGTSPNTQPVTHKIEGGNCSAPTVWVEKYIGYYRSLFHGS